MECRREYRVDAGVVLPPGSHLKCTFTFGLVGWEGGASTVAGPAKGAKQSRTSPG